MKNKEEKNQVEESEKHLLLDHDYDNIQEFNYPLPSWWNGIFIICIVFAGGYFLYYQFLGGPSLKDEFTVEYKVILEKQAAFKKLNATFNPEFYQKILADNGVAKGEEVYELNCMPCHMEQGQGDVGPNLTDDHWLIAKGTPETIYPVVFNGSEANGMPVWSELISKEEMYQAVAYIMTFHNKFVKGKEPQGEKVAEK